MAITAERGTAIGGGGTGIAALVTTAIVTGLTAMVSVHHSWLSHSVSVPGIGTGTAIGGTGIGIKSHRGPCIIWV